MTGIPSALGDPIPAHREVIEIRVSELKQLFHTMDPSPLRERDLDPKTEEFIVGWAHETRREAQLALLVHIDRPAPPEETAILGDAIRGFFTHRARASRRRLRQLLQRGRVSLLIGVFFLAASVGAGGVVESALAGERLGAILRESLLIGGWVAMWRPLEIFLYDWWPIRAEARHFDRLSILPVEIVTAASPAPHGTM